jgi:hypothetical protein
MKLSLVSYGGIDFFLSSASYSLDTFLMLSRFFQIEWSKIVEYFCGGITNGHLRYEHHECAARMLFASVVTMSDTIGKIFYILSLTTNCIQ